MSVETLRGCAADGCDQPVCTHSVACKWCCPHDGEVSS